jgi:hypothetical protein
MDKSIISDILFDAIDVKNALSNDCLSLPKDNEGTETTVLDCLDNIIDTLEQIETSI